MTYFMILVHACELHSSSEIGRYHLGGVKVTNFLASTRFNEGRLSSKLVSIRVSEVSV